MVALVVGDAIVKGNGSENRFLLWLALDFLGEYTGDITRVLMSCDHGQ